MAFKNKYVNYVIGKIREADPAGYGLNTIVLVSYDFYYEVMEEAEYMGLILGVAPTTRKLMLIADVVVQPVPWLKDGEFEIRPQGNAIPKMQYVIPVPSVN